MAKDFLIYRLIVSVRGSEDIANDDAEVDEIAEALYSVVEDVVYNVGDRYGVEIVIDEE